MQKAIEVQGEDVNVRGRRLLNLGMRTDQGADIKGNSQTRTLELTLKTPPPAERQLTETKWDAAEQSLRDDPSRQSSNALATPHHVYMVVRNPDGSLTRTRTKSHEETNVDLVASPCPGGRPDLLVRNPTDAVRSVV